MYELHQRKHIITIIFLVLTVLMWITEDDFVFAIDNNNGEVIRCIKTERESLLKFKGGLIDEFGMMSSWGKGKECCEWEGVLCSNTTGHVIGIQLQGNRFPLESYYLGGEINSALLELHHLIVLDLNNNNFEGNQFPEIICSMSQLQHLNLNHSNFIGTLPSEIGNLTTLESLDLSYNQFNGTLPAEIENLTVLETLNLVGNQFFGTLPPQIKYLINLKTLNLSWNQFSGTLPSEIGNLTNLESFDLSYTQFSGTLPSEIGKLTNLESFDLSYTQFSGTLPSEIGNLTNLESFDLSYTQFSGTLPSEIGNLTNLESFDLSYTQFSGTLPSEIGNLTNLESLDLSGTQFSAIPPELGKLINLETLDLSRNINFSAIPPEIGNLTNLRTLDLYYTHLSRIPPHIGNLVNLETLDLSRNFIFSSISLPLGFWNLANLESLDLSNNQLSEIVHPRQWKLTNLKNLDLSGNDLTSSAIDSLFHLGTNHVAPSLRRLYLESNKLKWLPSSIWKFSMLEELLVSHNSLMEGTITEAELIKLPNLKVLDFSYSSLTLDISPPDWTPPFQLSEIHLSGCKVGPHFPLWLRTQSNYTSLDLSNSSISGEVPNWFWSLSPEADYINLSHNQLNGTISNFSSKGNVDVSFNKFSGPMPLLSPTTSVLLISHNMFSGSLLFNCSLIFDNLIALGLSNNQLSGNLHNCWEKMPDLMFLDFANNNFSGEISRAFGTLFQLQVLNLANNNFHGKLPSTLKECSDLQLIDIGDNMLSGSIPTWIGEYHESMGYLILRNNRFNGSIPLQICYLSYIQVLDLSGNNISGSIPPCFSNFTYLVSEDALPGYSPMEVDGIDIVQYTTILWKRTESEYARGNLNLLKLIDLSGNMLDGNIPRAFISLKVLHSLNLSRNRLTGMIDPDICEMGSLESLDLSSNRLTGVIPDGMALLIFLSVLDLANNNFSGKIPTGTQLQTFPASAYSGNIGLCGSPLQPCPGDRPDPSTNNRAQNVDDVDDGILSISFLKDYGISIILGFIFGFWGVVGSLIVKESWRKVFYDFWDDVGDWVYVRVIIFWKKLRRSSS